MADQERGRISGSDQDACCSGSDCCAPEPPRALDRRGFLALSTAGTAGAVLGPTAAAASALGVDESSVVMVPVDKGISHERRRELRRRGRPTRYAKGALGYIGMPVGGITAGRVYLGGDGRLWLWDVNNPETVTSSGWQGRSYRNPPTPTSPFRHGVALRTTAGGKTRTRALDSDGFAEVTFTGTYPVGTVGYRDDDSPVEVDLEAFSPFVPTDYHASSLPATVLVYTLSNPTGQAVDVTLAGWSESPVCLDSREQRPLRLRAADVTGEGAQGLEFSAADGAPPPEDPRPEIVVEDFERTTYDGWTVEGEAFGSGPVTPDSVPDHFKRFGDLHVHGTRFATSYAFWADGPPDSYTGKLISRDFTIERHYITVGVGGGHWEGETCVNLVVDGTVIGSRTGIDMEPLRTEVFDVRKLEGRTARIEIVDANTGGWGHINCDYILMTDEPDLKPVDELPDHGTFAMAAVGAPDGAEVSVLPSLAASSDLDAIFDSGKGPTDVDASERTITGAVRVRVRLEPRASTKVRLVAGWYFPVPRDGQFDQLVGVDGLRHHYASRFDSARAVVRHLGAELPGLEASTRAFVRTWYDDSTLPYWFLERTLAPASTLATTTCYRFADGRFYAQEGEYCCNGTCQHVWNYAQSVARLFPELERDTRERVDLGIAMQDNGQMGNRGELFPDSVAHDGQAGTILRIYREHQMSTDDTFLRRVWPKVKKALDYLVRDDGEPDGIFEGRQYNTLDQAWFGEIPWISGLYVAALRAGAEMAADIGDKEVGRKYRGLAEAGSTSLAEHLWNPEYGYFFQRVDPAHADATNSNRGSFVDQLYGETYAKQLGLPRIFPADKSVTALRNIYRYNFLSDHEGFRDRVAVEGGRWFAMQGEAGLLMCAWPFGGDKKASGGGEPFAIGYFNEVWTGQEYQVAANMIAEGLIDEGLVLTRAVHDRYTANKRNPYNEIECSDHYARGMMSHAVYLAMCGYEYHGPRGHLGFAPKLSPERFRAAFVTSEGWGSYHQQRNDQRLAAEIELRHGRVRLRTLAFEVRSEPGSVEIRVGDEQLGASFEVAGSRVTVTLDAATVVSAGQSLHVLLT